MAKKKTVNWAAIKKRYLQGEKPKDIANDYELTSKQIRDKASNENWLRQKTAVFDKIENAVISELEEIHSIYGALIKDFGKDFANAREAGVIGLTVQDGEGFSSRPVEAVIKAGLASYLEKQKHTYKLQLAELTKQDPEETETPGFNIGLDA